jgi:hypothetical protein
MPAAADAKTGINRIIEGGEGDFHDPRTWDGWYGEEGIAFR